MSKNALIVDDSRLACMVMAKMLESFEINSIEVYSGDEALECLKHYQPDVIFLDHTMPGMHGLELIQEIKNTTNLAHIPILMHTAKEGDSYVNKALELGAADVLPKGLEKRHLFKVLTKLGIISSNAAVPSTSESFNKTSNKVTPVNLSNKENSPEWELFWLQKAEPYLEEQKIQQQKDWEFNTKQQTRKLNREMHLTLEQFEHALVLRMESHSDFVSSVESVNQNKQRKWLLFIGGLILILQSMIFWQFSKDADINQSQANTQQESLVNQKITGQKLAKINNKLLELELTALSIEAQIQQKQPKQRSLVTEQGEYISDLLVVKGQDDVYQGISSMGYQFKVNSEGEIIGQSIQRYFLSDNCIGEAYVELEKSNIYRDLNLNFWFIDHQAERLLVNINSSLNGNSPCLSVTEEQMNLFPLMHNNSNETGISEFQKMKIVTN